MDSRGNCDVVGDLELVEEFPGVAGTSVVGIVVNRDDVGGLTSGDTCLLYTSPSPRD